MAMYQKIKSIPLYVKIMIGMGLGILLGMLALSFNFGNVIQDWIQPWGKLFIRLLQLVAVPLVFISLVKGIMGLKDVSRLSRLGGKTIGLYIATTVVAVCIGISLGYLFAPGDYFDKGKATSLLELYKSNIDEKRLAATEIQNNEPLSILNDIVPQNIVSSLSNNGSMLQIIFFAFLFGLAALCIPRVTIEPVVKLFDGLNDIILKMVDFVISLAPYGVMALMAGLTVNFSGDSSLFGALGMYALTVILGLLFLGFGFYPLMIHLFSKQKVGYFLRKMYPVQLIAFSTSSSSATLPVTIETVEKELGVSNEVASFVLPIGATINMDGTSCFQAISVLFIAQVIGIDLSVAQIISIITLTVISSIGTPGIPGGSYVILSMVLSSVGIPLEGLALIMGVDRPLDMLRTSVNVTGDAMVASIIDKKI